MADNALTPSLSNQDAAIPSQQPAYQATAAILAPAEQGVEHTVAMTNETATSTAPGGGAGASDTRAADSNIGASNPVRPGGAPARVYMNEKIVPYLLEGMKNVTKEQPSNPLRVLGEFLIQKSNEVEGGQSRKAPE
ncbi:DPY30/SDC1 family protein [Aspergillus lucknowensis]|uniref:COMPASS complex subunit Sdc1 n=1 Tax=Aspergillus lucknowensis TaxID=176173 RepID=A0ABR4LRG4_9EURO